MIGTLGDLTFTVSSNKVFTYKDLTIKSGVRVAEHDSLQSKPTLEFIGESLDEISLKFDLRVENKINPITEFNKLKEKMKKAEELLFFVGDKKIGKFIIVDLSQEYRRIDNLGNILALGIDVNLKEIATKPQEKKKPVKVLEEKMKSASARQAKKFGKELAKKGVTKKPVLTAGAAGFVAGAELTKKITGVDITKPFKRRGKKK